MKSRGKFLVATGVAVAAAVGLGIASVEIRGAVSEIHSALRFAVAWRLVIIAAMDILPIAVASSTLIVFSLIFDQYDLPKSTPLIRGAGEQLAILVLVGILLAVWQAALGPRMKMAVIQRKHQSSMAIQAWDDAQFALEAGLFRDAREKAGLYGAITGESVELQEFLEDLSVREVLKQSTGMTEEEVPEEILETAVQEMTVADLIRQAQEFYDLGRYYSAHYYATRAVELSPVERLDARRLQQRAWDAIQNEGRAIEDEEEQGYYNRKFAAYTAFQRSVDSPEMKIEAYYRFGTLAEERPDDPDVVRYLPEIEAGMADISFFIDVARSYESYPGVYNLVFENDRHEFVAIDHLVQVREGDFAYGIEVIRIDDEGEIIYHFRAPYGKFISGDLVLRAIRREGIGVDLSGNMLGPDYLVGERPPEVRAFLRVHHDVSDLVRFGPGAEWLQQENIARLVMAVPVFVDLGLPLSGIYVQLVERVLRIFGSFILLFAMVALGWRYRSRYLERPPVLVLLTVPAFPVAVWGLAVFVRYLSRIILLVSFSLLGRTAGYVFLGVLPLMALLWALGSIARQQTD